MTHRMFKIQRQSQRETAAADGVISAVIIIMLALVMLAMFMIFTATARAGENQFGVGSSEFGVDIIQARQAVAEIRSLSHEAAKDVNRWTAGDTALQALFLTTLAIDRAQTIYTATHPIDGNRVRFEEGWARHFIGDHPSSGQVNRYSATCALLHTAVAIALPKEMKIGGETIYPRTLWQSIWIGAEISTIDRNISAGVSFRFY